MATLLPLLLVSVVVFIIPTDGRDLPEEKEGRISYCPRHCCLKPFKRSAFCRNARQWCDCRPLRCYGSCGSGGRCKTWCSSSEQVVSGSCSGPRCRCCESKPPPPPPCPTYGSSCGTGGTWKSSCSSNENMGEDKWCSGSRYCCCSPKTADTKKCSDYCISSSKCRPPHGFPFPRGGSCPSGQICCVIEPMCGDHFCRDVKEDEKEN